MLLLPEKADLSVVIPSFCEGAGIEDTLVSLQRQAGEIDRLRTEILVVINNASDASEEIVASNRITSNLVGSMASEMPPNMRLHEVDLWTPGFAPEQTSVDVARHFGFRRAVQLTKRNGVIVTTDADSKLGQNYLATAHRLFQQRGEVDVAMGTVYIEPSADDDENLARIHFEITQRFRGLVQMCYEAFADGSKHQELPIISGANLAFRNRALRAFLDRGPCSESELVNMIIRKSDFHFSHYLAAMTSSRASGRTGHGFGEALERVKRRQKPDRFSEVPVDNPAVVVQTVELIDILDRLRTVDEEDAWIAAFGDETSKIGLKMSAKNVRALRELAFAEKHFELRTYHHSPEMRMWIRGIIAAGKKPTLREGLKQLYSMMLALNHGSLIFDLPNHDMRNMETRAKAFGALFYADKAEEEGNDERMEQLVYVAMAQLNAIITSHHRFGPFFKAVREVEHYLDTTDDKVPETDEMEIRRSLAFMEDVHLQLIYEYVREIRKIDRSQRSFLLNHVGSVGGISMDSLNAIQWYGIPKMMHAGFVQSRYRIMGPRGEVEFDNPIQRFAVDPLIPVELRRLIEKASDEAQAAGIDFSSQKTRTENPILLMVN